MRTVRAVFIGVFSLYSLIPLHAAERPGAIPGGFSVSDQGAGQYTIPIATPAATGGLKPSLALRYNHLAGNGLAGMRVTLSGFSSIARCQQTYAQDGQVVATQYDTSDRFCLDGQRLVGISGTYGASGSEYRTEIETFQRIKSQGTAGAGPQYFTVEHGDGSISYYGYTSDSRIERVGASDVRLWYISFYEDKFGNRIEYSYSENGTTGEVLPTGVAWTRSISPSLSPRYSVTIVYETRPSSDQRSGVDQDGAIWAKTKRINYIEVEYNGSEIATYDLAYSTGTSGRSQLDDVTLSRGTDTLPETVFAWQDTTVGWGSATNTGRSAGSDPLIGDFNNDGNMDIVVNLSNRWQVYTGTDSGSLNAAIDSGQSSTTNPDKARLLDYDGDGDSDLLYQSGSYWYVMKSNGTSWASPVSTGVTTASVTNAITWDFDGDGLVDWLNTDGSGNLSWRRNQGGSFASPSYLLSGVAGAQSTSANVPPADFNGDGRHDLMYGTMNCLPPPNPCYFNALTMVSEGSGYTYTGTFYSTTYSGGAFPLLDGRVLDINGDGMDDLMYALNTTNTWYVRLSNGNAGLGSAVNTGISATSYASAMVADYNNDGRDDLLRYASGNYYVHLSTGTTLSSSATTNFSAAGSLVGDISGDGFPELAYVSGGNWHIRTHNTDLPDVVTSFSDGLGAGVDVTYESLSQTHGAHYHTGVNPSGPYVQAFNGARYVVTHEDRDDGIGGTHNYYYLYSSAHIDRSGRGWLSFWAIGRIDDDQGTEVATWFDQSWPLAGTPQATRSYRVSDWQMIQESIQTWDDTAHPGSTVPEIYFIRVESTTTKDWEIGGIDDGDLVRTVVDNPSYDTTYGHVETRTVTTTDPSSNTWTTFTDYNPTVDTGDWCLNLPGQVITTNTKPDSTYATRKLNHSWNADCSLNYTIDESEASTADQLKTSFTYDGYGNPNVVSTDSVNGAAQNRSIDYDYDSWGHAVTSETIGTVSLATTRTWDYINGQPASETGPDGLTTSYSYDSFGRIEAVDTPTIDTDYSYVACGTCFPGDAVYYVHADHSDGSEEYEYFDALNRSVGTAWTLRGGGQGRKETEYNALGQVDRTTQPYVSGESKFWVTYEYDLIGRVTEEDAPVSESVTYGATTTTAYLGETVQVTDAENNVTKTEYNAVGQAVKVTDANNNYATYTYKPFGELASMTDAESNTTTIGYDARGFKSSMSDPNMGSWSYGYNIYGELDTQTNALSQTTTLEYDEAGRLEERDEAEGTTTWLYHTTGTGNKGKVSTISAPGSYSELYWYDATTGQPSQVRRTIDSTNYDFNMTYDGHGRLNVLTYPTSTSGYRFKVDYDYDSYGHLQYVKDGNETYTYYTLSSTDALGRERSVSLGNSRTETRDYDEGAGYLKSIATSGSVQDLEFTYDEVGNVLTRKDNLITETETFTYDNVNRLKTSTVTGESTVTLNYSAAGRITSKTGVGSYSYGAGSAGPFAVTSANGQSYTYDANGRMITRGSDDITWYSFDKPKKIENGSNYTEFWYGPDRARYRQDVVNGASSATIRYASMLFEFEDPTSGSDVYRHYVQSGDRVVAMVERVGTTNTKHFLHKDNQGSVTKVTNSSGTVIQSLAYDAWGLRRDATDWSALGSPFAGSHETERGYTGHEHLDAVGLIHMNGRVQDPVLGRFISADPFVQAPYSTQSHNRYSYVWNNPASMRDPSGFEAKWTDYSEESSLLPQIQSVLDSLRSQRLEACRKAADCLVSMGRVPDYAMAGDVYMHMYMRSQVAAFTGGGAGRYGPSGSSARGSVPNWTQSQLNRDGTSSTSSGSGYQPGDGAETGPFMGQSDGASNGARRRASREAQSVRAGQRAEDEANWEVAAVLRSVGQSARVLAGREIRLEIGSATLGIYQFAVNGSVRPLDADETIIPTIGSSGPSHIASAATGVAQGPTTTVWDAGYDNAHGFSWLVTIPRQATAHGTAASPYVTIYRRPEE